MYLTFADLSGLIPAAFLVQALDDDADGQVDAFEKVATEAGGEVDAILSVRYTVPWSAGAVPLIVRRAALTLAAELCYRRRGTPDEQNPWLGRAADMRKLLLAAAKGDLALQASAPAVVPLPPAASIIIEESRLGTGRLG